MCGAAGLLVIDWSYPVPLLVRTSADEAQPSVKPSLASYIYIVCVCSVRRAYRLGCQALLPPGLYAPVVTVIARSCNYTNGLSLVALTLPLCSFGQSFLAAVILFSGYSQNKHCPARKELLIFLYNSKHHYNFFALSENLLAELHSAPPENEILFR